MGEKKPTPILLSALVCDDVRREVTGKDILIGVYADEIISQVMPFPVVLTLWLRFMFPSSGTYPLETRVIDEESTQLSLTKFDFQNPRIGKSATIVVGQILLQISKQGRMQFQWRAEGQDWLTAVALTAVQGRPDVTPPPKPSPTE